MPIQFQNTNQQSKKLTLNFRWLKWWLMIATVLC